MKTTPTRLVSPLSAGGSPAFAALRVSCTRLLTVLLLIGFGAFIGLIDRAAAQGVVPERFSFQGYMEDGNGQPLGPTTPVNYNVIFKIFPAATGGALVWAERQIVTFDKGNYSVILGQGTQNGGEPHGDLSAVAINATSSELYVETIVNINGSDTTIKPRLRLLPAMYAFLAKKALSADQALSVNGSAILPGSITVDRLSTTLSNSLLTAPIPDTRLSANVLSGAIADSRLSTNVARRAGGNTFTGNQSFSGNIGINTTNPTATLDINGTLKATNIVGRINGDDAPLFFAIGTNNINLHRQVLVDATTLLADDDGGRIRLLVETQADRKVWAYEFNYYADTDDSVGWQAGPTGYFSMAITLGGTNSNWILGNGAGNMFTWAHVDLPNGEVYFRNCSSDSSGNLIQPAFTGVDRYKFYVVAAPGTSFKLTIFDR
jgi:hypothetical protein